MCLALACDSGSPDDITECCTLPAKCSTIEKTANFCSADGSKVYNPAKKDSSCKALACVKETADDITACCTAPAKCSTIANTKGFCETDGTGKLYDHANKRGNDCQASACDAKEAKDIAACCSAGSRAKCSTVEGISNFCTTGAGDKSGKVYNANNKDRDCLALACDSGSPDDITECCDTPANLKKCSTIANTKGFCTGGKFYDAAKKDADCKASTCNSGTAEDQAACCSTGTQALCSTVSGISNFCTTGAGAGSGKVYNPANHDHTCLALACDSGSADDITECCTAPAKCETIKDTKDTKTGKPFCETGKKLYDSRKARQLL